MFGESLEKRLYLELLRTRPDAFRNSGEESIRICLEESEIKSAEQAMRWTVRGESVEAWGSVGVLYADVFYKLVKDAVEFPDGKMGTYIRMMDANAECRGVAILPEYDGKFILIRQYRHATRKYHLAIPRGFGSPGVLSSVNAMREIKEEIGCEVDEITGLGSLHPDTGILSGEVELFHAKVSGTPVAQKSEGVEDIMFVNEKTLANMIRDNVITDSFTMAAFARSILLR